MGILLIFLKASFSLLILSMLVFFFFVFLSTWARLQDEAEKEGDLGFRDVVSLAAIEWGSHLILLVCQFMRLEPFHEAPPINRPGALKDRSLMKHLPILLIPSLHSNPGIFRSLRWRLITHSFTSLWPFQFKPFLEGRALLKEDLRQFIRASQKGASSQKFRVISFGTSHPLVSEILSEPEFLSQCLGWISISGCENLSRTLKFLMTTRTREVFLNLQASEKTLSKRTPDLLIRGSFDAYCYPALSVFPKATQEVAIEPLGHYGVLLHPKRVQSILEELNSLGEIRSKAGG